MTQDKPILVPVGVPWMISPSAPFMRLHRSSGSLFATFVGFFLQEPDSDEDIVKITHDPGTFVRADHSTGARHRLVKVDFIGATSGETRMAYSDSEVVPESLYDWSRVPGGMPEDGEWERAEEDLRNEWMKTGICPDPLMYEVIFGNGAEQGDPSVETKHYLLLGHDVYLEVDAVGWRWTPGQPVI